VFVVIVGNVETCAGGEEGQSGPDGGEAIC
jgi:hypothetical protein